MPKIFSDLRVHLKSVFWVTSFEVIAQNSLTVVNYSKI